MFPHPSCKRLWPVWSISLLLLTTTSCRSTGARRAAVPLSANEQILVDAGDSSQPAYSPRGDQLVFVSAHRPAHPHAQVYVRDGNGLERRITFSNGDVERPSFHPREALIVYASSMDELKEFSPLLRTPASRDQNPRRPAALATPMDIYVHDLNSYDIDRLSQREGFDGQPRFAEDGRAVTFTVGAGPRTRVQSIQRATRATRVLQGLGANPTDYVIAPDQTASAWLEYDPEFARAALKLRREKQTREIAAERPGPKTDPNFSPDSRWLFWSEFDPATQSYAPFSLELETGCVRALPFTVAGSRRHPTLSPDGQWLTYTLVGVDKSRIARSPFAARPGPCATPP